LVTVRKHRADAVLVDVSAPAGIQFIAALFADDVGVPVIAVSVMKDEQAVLSSLEAGATGVLDEDFLPGDVVTAVEAARRGELHCSPRIASLIGRRMAALSAASGESTRVRLTPQEQRIMQLRSKGLSTKEIARELVIEPQTVKNHIHNARVKLGITGGRNSALRGARGWS
jgi:DNA-binding NarL/FixJ family response regulator